MISLRTYLARMTLLMTDTDPNGATSVAGAYAYARKFPVSPIAIRTMPRRHIGREV